jgi:acetyl esterase/lipase
MLIGSLFKAALALGAAAGAVITSRAWRARGRLLEPVLPELRSPVLLVPLNFSPRTLPLLRPLVAVPSAVAPGVLVEERVVPAQGGCPGVTVYVYDRPSRPRPSGALLWMHGGGYVARHPAGYHALCSQLCRDLDIVVVSVDYRLAPEHPFPAAIEDCHAALRWVHDHADSLGIDPQRIAVGGDSAGGGLAAALAQLVTDRGEAGVCFQLLVYPMLDDRTVLRTHDGATGAFVWTTPSNEFAWASYLGAPPGGQEDRPYAVPARREDLTGLPPAWIGVGDLDLFHDECVDYAERLAAAGVACDLEVVPGMYHAADVARPGSPAMRAFTAARDAALRAAVGSA